MLRYLGLGPRDFARFPLRSEARLNWEFYAVLRGRCAPTLPAQPRPALRTKTIWLFPPGSAHGWIGDRRHLAHITAFHFGSVPPQLEAAVRQRGPLSFPLTDADCTRLGQLARRLQPDFLRPNSCSDLVFQGALIELSLLLLRRLPLQKAPRVDQLAKDSVEQAIAWFTPRLEANPTVVDAAGQLHVSPSTLRRRFQQVRGESPVRVFAKIRLEKAMRLMAESPAKLEAIAVACGFANTSDFCRAFKAYAHVTPHTWRRTILAPPPAAIG